jgi:hypothetical protein
MASFLGTIASGVRNIFQDTFNRSNTTSSLGIASDGSLWSAIRGTFKITTNRASSTDAASTYPLATVDMPKEAVTINLKGVTQGSTAALWVTNSGNWYGIGIDQAPVQCNCQTCSTPGNCNFFFYQCNAYGYVCNAYGVVCNSASYPCNAYSYMCNSASYPCNAYRYVCNRTGNRYCRAYSSPCTRFVGPMCVAWRRQCNAYNAGNCNNNSRYPCTAYSYMCNSASYPCNAYSYMCNAASYPCNASSNPCNSASYPCGSTNATTFYSCNCQTCYPQYIRFIQSISNTVSQITSWTLSAVVQSFKVIVSNINPAKTSATTTIKAYSDTNLSTQIGSDLTYTPTGVAINAKYGIMVKPSTYAQGNTIDEITIES